LGSAGNGSGLGGEGDADESDSGDLGADLPDGDVDDLCGGDDECASELACVDGRCRELCDPDPDLPGDDECDAGRVCTQADDPLPGVCLEPCVMLTPACSVDGDACNVESGTGGAPLAVCTSNPGVGISGDECVIDGDCLPSYLCTPELTHAAPCVNNSASCCTPSCDQNQKFCAGPDMVCYLLGIEDQPDAGYCGS
jgi:hypothetical protein